MGKKLIITGADFSLNGFKSQETNITPSSYISFKTAPSLNVGISIGQYISNSLIKQVTSLYKRSEYFYNEASYLISNLSNIKGYDACIEECKTLSVNSLTNYLCAMFSGENIIEIDIIDEVGDFAYLTNYTYNNVLYDKIGFWGPFTFYDCYYLRRAKFSVKYPYVHIQRLFGSSQNLEYIDFGVSDFSKCISSAGAYQGVINFAAGCSNLTTVNCSKMNDASKNYIITELGYNGWIVTDNNGILSIVH